MSRIVQSVEEWLNSVDYEHKGYMPKEFAMEFINFIKLVNSPGGEEDPSPVVHYKMLDNIGSKESRIANMCSRGLAKSLPLTTNLFTNNGTIPLGKIKVGEKIFGEDGELTTVTHKSEIFRKPMYEILLTDGRTQTVSEDHINTVIHRRKVRYGVHCKTEYQRRNLTTKELLNYAITSKRKKTKKNPSGYEVNFWVPNCKALNYTKKDLPLDPYTLGVILGDGSSNRKTGFVRLHGHKNDFPHYRNNIPYPFGTIYIDKRNTNIHTQSIKGIGAICKQLGINVHGDIKRIPPNYLQGSIEQRTALLQGLMDTDGTCYKNGGTAFCSNSIRLAEDVQNLVRSLGGIAKISPTGDAFRVNIKCNFSCFRLPRKAKRQRINSIEKVGIKSIRQVDTVDSQCIAVSNKSHTFLVDDYFVTHNTTLMGEYLFLYLGVYGSIPGFGDIDWAIYVSDSMDNGVKNMRKNLEFRWQNSVFLQTYIPEINFTEARWEFINADGQKFLVKGYGAKTGVRGSKEYGKRPTLAVLDDLLSDSDAKSATVIASIEDTVYNAVVHALNPHRNKIIWSGTPFNAGDPLYKAIESGAWSVNLYPICEEFPCSEEDFRGAWSERFSYKYVKREYENALLAGKVDAFNQELMLRIMSDEERVILDADINWYNRGSLLLNKDNYNFYITTDFATSEKKSADNSVIIVWAINNKGFMFWVDGIVKKQLMDQNINDLFRLVSIYHPLSVGVEVSGQQGGFVRWIRQEMIDRNIFFNFATNGNQNNPGIRPSGSKFERFMRIVPWFKAGRMFFPEELKEDPRIQETMLELSQVAYKGFKSKRDDCLDGISQLEDIQMFRPSEATAYVMEEDGIYSEYLIEDEHDGMKSYVV